MSIGNYSEALERQLAWDRQYAAAEKYDGLVSALAIESGVPQSYAKEWARLVMLPLAHGEPFYWSSSMCNLLDNSSSSLDDWVCDPTILPCASGFMYFATPIQIGLPKPVHAIGWEILYKHEDTTFVPFGKIDVGAADVILVTSYSETHGQVLPASTAALTTGSSIRQGPSVSAIVGHSSTLLRKNMIFASAILLMNQRLIQTESLSPERHVRKRLERGGATHIPNINVVSLRKIVSGTKTQSKNGQVEWNYQWVVRGHWRQQPCGPKRSQRQPKGITPYIKGPEDKPLKPPRATVFAVVR